MKIFSHTHSVCRKIAGKIFSSDLRKPCLKTGKSLSPPTKLILFKRKSLTTLLKQDEKSTFTIWLTWWWQPSWILPSWIQPFCTKLWLKLIQSDSNSFILTQLDDGSHLEFCHVGVRHCDLGFRHLVIFSQIHSKTLSLHSDWLKLIQSD